MPILKSSEKEQDFVSKLMHNVVMLQAYPQQRERAFVSVAYLKKYKDVLDDKADYATLVGDIELEVSKAKGVLLLDIAKATTKTTCDYCGETLGSSYMETPDSISMYMPAKKSGGQKHFCGTGCLAGYLEDMHGDEATVPAYASENEATARDISYKERKHLKSGQFIDPSRRSFPIENCQDVKAAVHAWGRYKGSMSFDEFKQKLTEKANKLGCPLPKAWTDGK